MRAWFGVLLATMGCDGGEETPKDDATPTDGDTDTGDDTGTPTDTELPPCTNEVVSATPSDGAVDVPVGTPIPFTLAEAYPNAIVTVTDPEGNELPGTTTVDGPTLTWSGLPLRPATTYTSTVSHDCATESSTWTTEASVADWIYALDLGDGTWVEPPGVGDILAQYLVGTTLLVSPTSVRADTIDLLLGSGVGGVQDTCVPTAEVDDVPWADDSFQAELDVLVLSGGDLPVSIVRARFSGTFTPDTDRLGAGVISGSMDTRPLAPLVDPDADPDVLCETVAPLGVECVECPDGEELCLDVRIEDLEGGEVPGPLDERTPEDILADPVCP